MPKSVKKSQASATEPTPRKAKAKNRNQDEAGSKGRLIALEGTRGKDLSDAVKRLARILEGESACYSIWDASNTFYELRMGKARIPGPPVRSLLLLYASDLMFRLRWEIEPALKEGRTVVAAPYVESAIAMGTALGLPKDWLTELFSFAPKPDATLRLKEKAKKKAGNAANGFVEFCCNSLAANASGSDPAELRSRVLQYLDVLEERKEIVAVGKKLRKLTVAAVVNK